MRSLSDVPLQHHFSSSYEQLEANSASKSFLHPQSDARPSSTIFGWMGITKISRSIVWCVSWGIFSGALAIAPIAAVSHLVLTPSPRKLGTRMGMALLASAIGRFPNHGRISRCIRGIFCSCISYFRGSHGTRGLLLAMATNIN